MSRTKKRRKVHDLSPEQWDQIKEDATHAYHQGWPENPYPINSDAWEAWESGIEWCVRLDEY